MAKINCCVSCHGMEVMTQWEYEHLCPEHLEENERNMALIEKARYEAAHDL